MEFSFVLFVLIVACLFLAATVTAVRHLFRRKDPATHHNSREDDWYWKTTPKRRAASR